MKNFLVKNKNQIIVVFSLIVFALIGFFLINGEYQKLTALSLENQEKTKQLRISQAKLDTLNKQAKQLDVINDKKDFVQKQITKEINATIFVSYLERLSYSLNIIPLTVSVGNTTTSTKESKLPPANTFNLTFGSDFKTLVEFLRQIEKLDRLNTISTINIGKAEEILNLSMAGQIFLEK